MKENYLSFEEAKKIVADFKIESISKWAKFCKDGKKPLNIPFNPNRIYKNNGWVSWPDFLNSEQKPNTNPLCKMDKEEVKRIMLQRVKEKVAEHGGKIIEGDYQNKKSIFLLECKNGHQWKSNSQIILRGSWCRKCFNEEKAGKHFILKDGLEQAQKIAEERGGRCLSSEYINNNKHLEFECNNGHKWEAALNDIKKGRWCPTCSQGVKERLCRSFFEQITSYEFPKLRPAWLLNSRGNQMELDGFCKELNLAFEYNGEYHYDKNNHFQHGDETLERRKNDDKLKINLCKENNITLITIPYTIETKELKNFIYNKLIELNLEIDLKLDIDESYVPSNELSELKRIAEERGGKCLSEVYLGATEKHQFQCSEGHIWEAIPSNIKNGKKTWCPLCKPNRIGDSKRKYSIEDMQEIAKQKNGKFLSDNFKSVNDKYLWQCEHGHEWTTTPSEILRGSWCSKCNSNKMKGNIFQMQELARSRNGKCISTEYIDSKTKLTWECQFGHQWEARPRDIKNSNTWCPLCTGKKKL